MNIARVPPSFGTKMQLQNDFHQIHVLLEPLTRQRMKSWQVEVDEPRLHAPDDIFWIKSTSNFLQKETECLTVKCAQH